MLRALSAAARAQGLAGRRVLVAISGGVDSTVLLHGLRQLAGSLELTVLAAHVNHGLRGAESEADARFVEELAAKLDVPLGLRRVDPEALRRGRSSRSRPTLQEAARRVRYDALASLAQELGAQHIATAHNADDQAETVLLRLLRGASPDGLGGIPERSADGRIVRPLLGIPRAEIERYARDRGLGWREDPSNARTEFARARLRQRWLPGLAQDFNPRLLRAIAELAEAQRRDSEWIEELVSREAQARFSQHGDGLRIRRDGWQELPEALARRLARRALRDCGAAREVSRAHLRRMVAFWREGRSGSRIEFPGGLELRCEREGFTLQQRAEPARVSPETACYSPESPGKTGRKAQARTVDPAGTRSETRTRMGTESGTRTGTGSAAREDV